MNQYDVVVVGGGHAGCEAALAAARLGCETLLVTLRLSGIAQMSCNPAIGGLAKGQLAREVDALGGEMGRVIDATGIQFRLLNRSRGPAVQAPRAQADKNLYKSEMRRRLEVQARLTLLEAEVDSFSIKADRIQGLRLKGREPVVGARAVIITTGTFLRGLMHTGDAKRRGGRVGDASSEGLSPALSALGFELGRLKTGTPPRLDGRTIEFSALEEQPGDREPQPFSFETDRIDRPQVSCFLTRTNEAIHKIIRANIHRAPMFTGQIEGVGPRYCPSIEDKVVRFADKSSHHVFLEPEGLDTDSIYPNGISTSLPADVQDQIVRLLPGCENARLLRHGYAVEYDYVPARQLKSSLETRRIRGLYFAGQINGTSGYEEAAAQGLVAGINAARAAQGKSAWVPDRSQSYIGVLIDDLVSKDIREPYRMFTSRSEYRLLLRHDNADRRLTPIAAELGLVSAARAECVRRNDEHIRAAIQLLETSPHAGRTWAGILRRPESSFASVAAAFAPLAALELSTLEARQVEIEVKYDGYVKRMRAGLERFRKSERIRFPAKIDFHGLTGLKREAAHVLARFRPETLGQASRLAGITPADIGVLEIHLRR